LLLLMMMLLLLLLVLGYIYYQHVGSIYLCQLYLTVHDITS